MSPVLEKLVNNNLIDLSIEHFELRPEGTPQIDFTEDDEKYKMLLGPVKQYCDRLNLKLCTEKRVLPRTKSAF